METSIPAAIVAAVLMVAAVVLMRTSHQSFDDLNQAWRQMEARTGDRARTELTITDVRHSPPSSPYVDVQVRSDGSTRLAEFDRMDVVVEYTDSGGSPVLVWIPYTAGPLAANTWTIQGIVADGFDPGILNETETLKMRIQLSPIVGNGTSNRLIIATELGVTVSTTFAG